MRRRKLFTIPVTAMTTVQQHGVRSMAFRINHTALTLLVFNTASFTAVIGIDARGQSVIYVDQNATGPAHDGSTWCDAFLTVQDALVASSSGTLVKVADGVYTPDQGSGVTQGDRAATFQLKSGVTIVGGFGGCGASEPDARANFQDELTILSGDLLQNDQPGSVNIDENAYNVVTTTNPDSTAVLQGVTIAGGYANGPSLEQQLGAGIYNRINAGDAVVRECIIRHNFATHSGGGMRTQGKPLYVNCILRNNRSGSSAGSSVSLGCSGPIFANCLFVDNTDDGNTGTIWHAGCPGDRSTEFINCTIANNADGGVWVDASLAIFRNSIIWGNGAFQVSQSNLDIAFSDVQGGYPGPGNIDANPLFVNGASGDFHLSGESPCIDAGDNSAVLDPKDLDGNPRIVDGNGDAVEEVDMGAFEFQLPVIAVLIDIKPGSDPNSINLGSHGVIPVAVLTTDDFDATTVDPDTVELAGSSVALRGNGNRLLASIEDVDDDGDVDLVLQVETENLTLETGATQVTLTGETFSGHQIVGVDTIVIVNE